MGTSERGGTYSKLKEYDKAIADYTKAMELDPENADYYDERAEVYDMLGNSSKAQQDRKKGKN
jgi:tetratricopeptide (TPR) repeat protein